MDTSALEMLIEALGPEDTAGLVEVFLSQSLSQSEELEGLLAGDDHGAVKRLAHALKGSSLNMGAKELADAFAALERSDDMAQARVRFDALRPILVQTREVFEGKLEELGG